jgi:hypothetical protein
MPPSSSWTAPCLHAPSVGYLTPAGRCERTVIRLSPIDVSWVTESSVYGQPVRCRSQTKAYHGRQKERRRLGRARCQSLMHRLARNLPFWMVSHQPRSEGGIVRPVAAQQRLRAAWPTDALSGRRTICQDVMPYRGIRQDAGSAWCNCCCESSKRRCR